ncbi:metallophosphoesterase domain-containing protein 1-like [Mya arenaria]|uniref:metallophosphoesterase domain-containing protein 1-like n=1 Tax=Mya arenaria TaxID=6604 RepID=UPI0022E2BFA0|nr:metallophosphoesterase domain-containing protein 1-like [Mya arenaria]
MLEGDGDIQVDRDTTRPTRAWDRIAVKQTVTKVTPLDPAMPLSEGKLRVVCISDTHMRLEALPHPVPSGDILLHAGDFTNTGLPTEIKAFDDFMGTLDHPVKIVIAGNHDLTLDKDMVKNRREYLKTNFRITEKVYEEVLERLGVTGSHELLTNCVYLEDAGIDVCGLHVYGSPWQPEFCDWGFNLPRGQACLEKWNLIPDKTDILITHGPPIGHGDACFDKQRAGCVELLATVQRRVRPRLHLFGHIHEGYGVTSDGTTTFVNASTCTLRYKPDHAPLVFDVSIPPGHTKAELAQIKPHRLVR